MSSKSSAGGLGSEPDISVIAPISRFQSARLIVFSSPSSSTPLKNVLRFCIETTSHHAFLLLLFCILQEENFSLNEIHARRGIFSLDEGTKKMAASPQLPKFENLVSFFLGNTAVVVK